MAKRDNGGKRTNAAAANTRVGTGPTPAPDTTEQRMVAFAEQVGRIVGTVQAKTEGWMDRDALSQQIAGVRDSATELLEYLKTTVTKATTGEKPAEEAGKSAAKSTTAAPSGSSAKKRSGGVVDAPGKKHRKPMPKDSRALAADAKAANLRSSRASMKTMKQRGRG